MPAQDLGAPLDGQTFAQNVIHFTPPLTTGGGSGGERARRIRVTAVSTVNVTLQMTLDGANWETIATLTGNTLSTVLYIPTRTQDQINFRTSSASGVTWLIFRVDQIFGEE